MSSTYLKNATSNLLHISSLRSERYIPLFAIYYCRSSKYIAIVTLGQLVPNCFPLNMAWVVYPPSPHIVQNSRELSVKGASAPPLIGGLPLTGGPGCSISRRRGGGISSRAAPFPMIGKGRGNWVEHERRFTYELY